MNHSQEFHELIARQGLPGVEHNRFGPMSFRLEKNGRQDGNVEDQRLTARGRRNQEVAFVVSRDNVLEIMHLVMRKARISGVAESTD